jgi:hypothetical protein
MQCRLRRPIRCDAAARTGLLTSNAQGGQVMTDQGRRQQRCRQDHFWKLAPSSGRLLSAAARAGSMTGGRRICIHNLDNGPRFSGIQRLVHD